MKMCLHFSKSINFVEKITPGDYSIRLMICNCDDCDRHVDCQPTMSCVTGEKLDLRHCETIEEILRRVQFRTIDLEATHLDVEVSNAAHRHTCLINNNNSNNI